jgi:hypothetical protein
MKKYILLLPFVLLTFVSCNDELELNPFQSLGTAEALGDLDGMQTALNGAYDRFQAVGLYGRNYVVIPEIQADMVYLTISNSNRFIAEYTYDFNPQSGNFATIWNFLYNGILRVNNIINNIDDLEGDAARKNQIKGEALALRALAHFDLVRFFAKIPTNGNAGSDLGVPVVLESIIAEPPRNTVAEVYTQIIADLQAAKGLVADDGIYKFSKEGIDALLARVYLYNGDYGNAATAASSVINSGKFQLADDIVAAFAAPGSSEEIFTLKFEAPAENNGSDNLGGIYNPQIYGDIRVATDLVDLYGDGDSRIGFLYVNTVNNEVYTSKYFEQDGINGMHSPKILRIAEMYLIRAEARFRSNDSGGALDDLNAIRAKRGVSALQNLGGIETILDERRRELAFEGHTLFDYIRTNTDIERSQCNTGLEVSAPCSISASSNIVIHPIPQREMDVNQNMQQNPGY